MKTTVKKRPTQKKLRTDAALAYQRALSPGERECLGCGKMFASAHSGNRLCAYCKSRVKTDNPLPRAGVF